MAISVQIGNVSKRKNSTFQPTLTASVDVVLKDGTSDRNPSFLLNSGSPISANYLKWGSHYYFITDIVYERNNLYTINCKLDALATYKANIAATSAFVAYDGTSNTELVDSRISMETTNSVQVSEGRFSQLGAATCAVLTITGSHTTAAFAMTETEAASLLNKTDDWLDTADVLPYPQITSLPDVGEAIESFCYNMVAGIRQLIATGNVNEAIKSAILIPLSASIVGQYGYEVRLGNYKTGVFAALVSPYNRFLQTLSLSIPWQATDWRRNSPFHELYLYLPHIGVVPISPSDVMGCSAIIVYINMSMLTGDTIFKAVADNGHVLGQYHTNLSTPYAIGTSNLSPYQAVTAVGSAIVGGAAAIASGGATAMIGGTAGIVGVTNNLVGTPASIGSNAGGALLTAGANELTIKLLSIYHDTNVAPNSVAGAIGTPAMAVKTLGGLSGYVECRSASVSAPAEDTVLDEINNYLNSGFFME